VAENGFITNVDRFEQEFVLHRAAGEMGNRAFSKPKLAVSLKELEISPFRRLASMIFSLDTRTSKSGRTARVFLSSFAVLQMRLKWPQTV